MLKQVQVYKEGKDIGALGMVNPLWWFDPKVDGSFSMFDLDSFYTADYFIGDHISPVDSAKYVKAVLAVGEVLLKRSVQSVLELGSGGGWFTKAFLDAGVDILGVEGSKVGYEKCLLHGIPPRNLIRRDLRRPFVSHASDIAVCSEVAEHIEPPFASQLVQNLANHSNLVWFSSYNTEDFGPHQAHYHHCNEQPAVFWKNLFSFYGFDMVPLPPSIVSAAADRGKFLFYSSKAFTETDVAEGMAKLATWRSQ